MNIFYNKFPKIFVISCEAADNVRKRYEADNVRKRYEKIVLFNLYFMNPTDNWF